jgi:hypothetical protein
MKVLKDGTPWTHKQTCRDCKSQLLIEEDDVCLGDFGSMGDTEMEYYATCIKCKADNIISETRIPEYVKEKARKKSKR